MKPTLSTPPDSKRLLAFGAHPDDIEFGAGAIIAREAIAGSIIQFVVCSRGESASHGSPPQRETEARNAAAHLGAELVFADLGGDAHFEKSTDHILTLAGIVRRFRPHWILAPTPTSNQHPDHVVLSSIVHDAARLARYGGVVELKADPAHAIEQLFYYAVTAEGEMPERDPVWIDVSDPVVLERWRAAMSAHATQAQSREYVELQMTRARLLGLRAGVSHAQAVFPADPLVVTSLRQLGVGARRF